MRKFDLSLRSSRSSYFATFRHQLTILSKTDALDEEKWLNMLGTFVKDWFRYESHFVHGKIGRASCRERVSTREVCVSFKEEFKYVLMGAIIVGLVRYIVVVIEDGIIMASIVDGYGSGIEGATPGA